MSKEITNHNDFVLACYRELPIELLNHITNGCGSSVWLLRRVRFPNRWCILFNEACLLHDLGYVIGGTEKHRRLVDDHFYWQCKRIARYNPVGLIWAFIGWRAVRRFGNLPGALKSWEARREPLTYEGLKRYALEQMQFVDYRKSVK